MYAKKISDKLQKELPIKNSENLSLTEVKTENTRVIITGKIKSTSYDIERTYNNNFVNIDKAKEILRGNTKKITCIDKYLTSFINLGGVIQYEYVLSDGKLFDIVAVTSCR